MCMRSPSPQRQHGRKDLQRPREPCDGVSDERHHGTAERCRFVMNVCSREAVPAWTRVNVWAPNVAALEAFSYQSNTSCVGGSSDDTCSSVDCGGSSHSLGGRRGLCDVGRRPWRWGWWRRGRGLLSGGGGGGGGFFARGGGGVVAGGGGWCAP